MTVTEAEAYEAMRTHHRILSDQLGARANAVLEAVSGGRAHHAAVAGLVTYLAEQVLPHAAAEEETIYPAAALQDGLIGTVNQMLAEHRALREAAGALASPADPATAAAQARQITQLFTAHAARENDVLLPALLADQGVDLAALLAQMHRRAEEAAQGRTGQPAARDPQGALLGLLLEAAGALARDGQAYLACRLAAAAWAAVREDRPDLAVTVTAALHGLARRASGGPAQDEDPAPVTGREPASPSAVTADPGGRAGEPGLDVRDLPPSQRHDAIFTAYRQLAPGEGFVLVNDHDPKPLRYQFEAEHPGEFTWDYLETGPSVWRVRIGRART